MSRLPTESGLMQNSALGALLVWRFAKAYQAARNDGRAAQFPTTFLVLPLVWHASTADVIAGTQLGSGLRKFAAKFTETEAARDVLLGVHGRALRWRPHTLAALRTGFSTGLVTLDPVGEIRSICELKSPELNATTTRMVAAAEKVGAWFAPLTLHELSVILYVPF